jgi:hypothetical protein
MYRSRQRATDAAISNGPTIPAESGEPKRRIFLSATMERLKWVAVNHSEPND